MGTNWAPDLMVTALLSTTLHLILIGRPERLKKLAAGLDHLMKKMAGSVKSFDGTKIAVLTALQIVDEYDKLKHDYDELVELLDEK